MSGFVVSASASTLQTRRECPRHVCQTCRHYLRHYIISGSCCCVLQATASLLLTPCHLAGDIFHLVWKMPQKGIVDESRYWVAPGGHRLFVGWQFHLTAFLATAKAWAVSGFIPYIDVTADIIVVTANPDAVSSSSAAIVVVASGARATHSGAQDNQVHGRNHCG